MKKIIHLSDLHVGHEDCGVRFRTIIDNIALIKQPAQNYIIVITGDIVENANQSEHINEAVDALQQFEKNGYKVLVIPDNHDYGTGGLGNRKFTSLFKKKYYGDTAISYPKTDIIDEIAFIGLDSTAAELHWYDRFLSQGELGRTQLKRLKTILDDPAIATLKKVVYLHHHPFDFKFGMQLNNNNDLKKVIQNRIDAILFGHYHDSSGAGKIFHGMWGIRRCYNAGSATHKNGNQGFHRVIDLSNNDPRVDYDGCFL
jgi:3',5'-cyclic AMP phosphodiesterase CpdA